MLAEALSEAKMKQEASPARTVCTEDFRFSKITDVKLPIPRA